MTLKDYIKKYKDLTDWGADREVEKIITIVRKNGLATITEVGNFEWLKDTNDYSKLPKVNRKTNFAFSIYSPSVKEDILKCFVYEFGEWKKDLIEII